MMCYLEICKFYLPLMNSIEVEDCVILKGPLCKLYTLLNEKRNICSKIYNEIETIKIRIQ